MMSTSENPVVVFSSWCALDPATGRGRAVGPRCDSRSETREFGGYRALATWHDKIGTTSDILIEWTWRIAIPILSRIPSISCLGARTSSSTSTWSSCNNHPARWRTPGCCRSCEAWTSAATTSAWVRGGFNGGLTSKRDSNKVSSQMYLSLDYRVFLNLIFTFFLFIFIVCNFVDSIVRIFLMYKCDTQDEKKNIFNKMNGKLFFFLSIFGHDRA